MSEKKKVRCLNCDNVSIVDQAGALYCDVRETCVDYYPKVCNAYENKDELLTEITFEGRGREFNIIDIDEELEVLV